MNRKTGCVVCEEGKSFFYYKNENDKKVRIEAFDCHVCSGGVFKFGLPKKGEDLISEEQFLTLIDQGWAMDDT